MDLATRVLDRAGLDVLVEVLRAQGYRVVGPTLRDSAIVLDELESGEQLPAGWGVESGPGHYRVQRRTDAAVFAHSAGAQSWKQFLHPAQRPLWTSDGTTFEPMVEPPVRYAFLGVRACDLASIAILSRVLSGGAYEDPAFAQRRAGLFVVAAGCTEPGGVCFCASMGTGPAPGPGYDLSLTERLDADGHRFLVDVGSDAGRAVLALVEHREATPDEVAEGNAAVDHAAAHMERAMPEGDLRTLLADSRESPRWEEIASRCLTCGNCTSVCPTCFCTTTVDSTDLVTGDAQRSQRAASCFELDFSFLHGGRVRGSGASRYRQWMTHKLSSWHDQFDMSGCVGCGRCIAWCPTGIDITEEAAGFASERAAHTSGTRGESDG
jgi:ferredoxin